MAKDPNKRSGCLLRCAIAYELVFSLFAMFGMAMSIRDDMAVAAYPGNHPMLFLRTGLFFIAILGYLFISYLLWKGALKLGAILMVIASVVPFFFVVGYCYYIRNEGPGAREMAILTVSAYFIVAVLPPVVMAWRLLFVES